MLPININSNYINDNELSSAAKLHILISNLYLCDAIGNFVRSVAGWAENLCIPCFIYTKHHSPSIVIYGDYSAFFRKVGRDDVLFYQLSNDDPDLADLMTAPCRRVVYYHNITPAYFFHPYHPDIADMLSRGRAALPLLSEADAVFANSSWSLAEIAPYLRTDTLRGVMPPLTEKMLDRMAPAQSSPAKVLPRQYILTVGRVVPHKNIIGGLRLFVELQKRLPCLHYVIMGGDGGIEGYSQEVRQAAAGLGGLSAYISFVGQTDDEEAAAWFRNAAALLCMSRHEGFGVPLVEAMACGVPIIALDQPAVRETLGAGGLLLAGENPEEDAARTAVLLTDAEAVKAMQIKQRERLAEIRRMVVNNVLWSTITPREYQEKRRIP
jgi:glycosyltransferase involved in cell wall biosynthesis